MSTNSKYVASTKITPNTQLQAIVALVKERYPTYDLNDAVKFLIAKGAQEFLEEVGEIASPELEKSLTVSIKSKSVVVDTNKKNELENFLDDASKKY